jgi:SAM-dependent methyltransferase
LSLIQSRVALAVGCDFNPAVVSSDGGGYEVLPAPFLAAAKSRPGAFSVAVSFHVLEHVSDVREIMAAARVALNPGGRLFLSVPDRDRTARAAFEVFDCPPHHLSRWSDAQFSQLADRHGWELVRIDHEPFVHRRGMRKIAPRPAVFAAGLLKHALKGGGVQRPRGMRVGLAADRWPRGLAVLTELKLPSSSTTAAEGPEARL